MRDLSVRGISRVYKNKTGTISLRNDICSGGNNSVSVRNKLEDIARRTHSYSMSECVYGWTAEYEQAWGHIVVKIRLDPDAGITNETMTNCRNTWQTGIESFWNNDWRVWYSGELACRLSFDVQFVESGQHHTVTVSAGGGGTNMTHWHTNDGQGTAAHEFGHMIGLVDEYTSSICPDRDPVETHTVMDDNVDVIPQRLVEHLAGHINSAIIA